MHQLVEAIRGTCITISYHVLGYLPRIASVRILLLNFIVWSRTFVSVPVVSCPYRDATLIGIGKLKPFAGFCYLSPTMQCIIFANNADQPDPCHGIPMASR
jgi:hypothetical protein